jgi:hypothetical protein
MKFHRGLENADGLKLLHMITQICVQCFTAFRNLHREKPGASLKFGERCQGRSLGIEARQL